MKRWILFGSPRGKKRNSAFHFHFYLYAVFFFFLFRITLPVHISCSPSDRMVHLPHPRKKLGFEAFSNSWCSCSRWVPGKVCHSSPSPPPGLPGLGMWLRGIFHWMWAQPETAYPGWRAVGVWIQFPPETTSPRSRRYGPSSLIKVCISLFWWASPFQPSPPWAENCIENMC